MISFLKTAFLFFILLIPFTAFSQLKFNPKIRNEFDSVLNLQPKDVRNKTIRTTFKEGITFILKFKEDTLNLNEYNFVIEDSANKNISVSTKNYKGVFNDTTEKEYLYNYYMASSASYLNDTLGISAFVGFFSGVAFNLKIFNNKCYGEYMEVAEDNPTCRINLTDTKSDQLSVKIFP